MEKKMSDEPKDYPKYIYIWRKYILMVGGRVGWLIGLETDCDAILYQVIFVYSTYHTSIEIISRKT